MQDSLSSLSFFSMYVSLIYEEKLQKEWKHQILFKITI